MDKSAYDEGVKGVIAEGYKKEEINGGEPKLALTVSSSVGSKLSQMDDLEVNKLNKDTLQLNLDLSDAVLSKEERLLDEEAEKKGCETILKTLSDDERKSLPDNTMVLRHLRAEKGDVELAIRKIKETLAWREEFRVSDIKSCFDDNGNEDMSKVISEENETGKIYIRGYDKSGRAIMYMNPAKENTKSAENNMKHLVYNLERAIACTQEKSGFEKINIVINYDGFKLRNAPPMATTRMTLNILQGHYPERLYRAYLCDPPRIFRAFWAMAQPFIDAKTKEKVIFCHGKVGKEVLEKNFDLDQMEPCAGGTGKNRPFDSKEFLSVTSFSKTFDEQ